MWTYSQAIRLMIVSFCWLTSFLTTAQSQDLTNPYQKAAVGDWMKYEVKVENSFSPLAYTSVLRVTAIDGDSIKITQDVTTDKGEKFQYHKVIDRSESLPLFELLGYDKPHELQMLKTDQGNDSVAIAKKTYQTEWVHYEIGRGTPYPGEKMVWFCRELPLDGVVRRQTVSKGQSSDSTNEILVAFGGANDPIPAGKSLVVDESTAELTKEVNGLNMPLVKIKGGSFAMGAMSQDDFLSLSLDVQSTEEQLELLARTPPYRQTIIKRDYWMAAHEVTVQQFRVFVEATGYKTEAEQDGDGGTGRLESGQFAQSPKFTWKSIGFPLKDKYPVVNVSWNDAQEFCRWLSKKETATYRLPTEAEWEFACRGGTTSRFFCGDQREELNGFANVADLALSDATVGLPWPVSFDDKAKYLAEVGSYKPNSFGLYDMHGNVLEWCQTRFSFTDPLEHLNLPATPEELYCLRGGNWFNDADRAGSACRTGAPPQTRMSLIGFRVVKVVSDITEN